MKSKRLRFLITAGPTREYLDPVRFISNESTGVMGYAIAEEAIRRGHSVTLVSGPVSIRPPRFARRHKAKFILVISADEMKKAIGKNLKGKDCLVMSAAVSDFRPRRISKGKIASRAGRSLKVSFVKNEDIVKKICANKNGMLAVGFSLETSDAKRKALAKLREKNLDMIVANSINGKNRPFGNSKVDVSIIERSGNVKDIKAVDKHTLANVLLGKIEALTTAR